MMAWSAHVSTTAPVILDYIVQLQYKEKADLTVLINTLRSSGAVPDPQVIAAFAQAGRFWYSYLCILASDLPTLPVPKPATAPADPAVPMGDAAVVHEEAVAGSQLELLADVAAGLHQTSTHVIALLLWQEFFLVLEAEGINAGAV